MSDRPPPPPRVPPIILRGGIKRSVVSFMGREGSLTIRLDELEIAGLWWSTTASRDDVRTVLIEQGLIRNRVAIVRKDGARDPVEFLARSAGEAEHALGSMGWPTEHRRHRSRWS